MKRYSMVMVLLLFTCVIFQNPVQAGTETRVLQDESGFFLVEPIHFYFHYNDYFSRLPFTSSEARMWYTFLKADRNSAGKPLFVFFNGGPGSGTSHGLMSHNTGRFTQDTGTEILKDEFIPNPFSWTRMGNLLYIDARQTGFSYSLVSEPENYNVRFQEFGAKNFNSYIDAADFVRLLLDFLARHPSIQKNPVVIVGESYGGIRATVLLHLLLNYGDYADGSALYQDPGLADRIQEHYNTVFPAYKDRIVPPDVIAGQFGNQVLIQPAVSNRYQKMVAGRMFEEEGSIIYRVAEEEGLTFIPCSQLNPAEYCNPRRNALNFITDVAKRDPYIVSKPRDWMTGYFFNASRILQNVANLSLITGVDVTSIPELYASYRVLAYRFFDLQNTGAPDLSMYSPEDRYNLISRKRVRRKMSRKRENIEDMILVFGRLRPWDRYHVGTNYDSNWTFYNNYALYRGYDIYPLGTSFGEMFLENVVSLNTFITNAKYDLVVYTAALPEALGMHTDILGFSLFERKRPVSQDRPGQIVLSYLPGAFPDLGSIGTRVIRFPCYDSSCHCVPLTQPGEIFRDVSSWLRKNGLPVAPGRGKK